jgi:hypothetical protein
MLPSLVRLSLGGESSRALEPARHLLTQLFEREDREGENPGEGEEEEKM